MQTNGPKRLEERVLKEGLLLGPVVGREYFRESLGNGDYMILAWGEVLCGAPGTNFIQSSDRPNCWYDLRVYNNKGGLVSSTSHVN